MRRVANRKDIFVFRFSEELLNYKVMIIELSKYENRVIGLSNFVSTVFYVKFNKSLFLSKVMYKH